MDTFYYSGSTAPTTILPADTSVCKDEVLLLELAEENILTTLWEDGSTDLIRIIDTPGVYIATQTNRCGQSFDTITVTHLLPPDNFDLGRDTFICEGSSLVLVAPSTPYHLRWQDNSDQPTLEITEAGAIVLIFQMLVVPRRTPSCSYR